MILRCWCALLPPDNPKVRVPHEGLKVSPSRFPGFVCVGSANLTEIGSSQVHVWLIFALLPLGIMFYIGCLAETNRHPFDLPEVEAEIVSGYNVDIQPRVLRFFSFGTFAILSGYTVVVFVEEVKPIANRRQRFSSPDTVVFPLSRPRQDRWREGSPAR